MLQLIVLHPHRNMCREITHWGRTSVTTVHTVEEWVDLMGPEETAVRGLWEQIAAAGSYWRLAGQPYYPVWLGMHGGMDAVPENSPTADWVWVKDS